VGKTWKKNNQKNIRNEFEKFQDNGDLFVYKARGKTFFFVKITFLKKLVCKILKKFGLKAYIFFGYSKKFL